MKSTTKESADILGEVIHRVMCYRGHETPVCKSDLGDGLHFARELDRLNLRLTIKEPKTR